MNSQYGWIPDKTCENYYKKLVDKLFKIIPLKEENADTVEVYIQDLIYELVGNDDVFFLSNDDSRVIDIVSILQSIKNEDMSHAEYRRAIFKCITLTNQLCEIVVSGG